MSDWQWGWDEKTDGTSSGATASHAGETGVDHRVTHISGHTDTDSFVTIRDVDASGAVLWQVWLDVSLNGNTFAVNIPNGVHGVSGNAIVGRVETSTSDCRVQISGSSVKF